MGTRGKQYCSTKQPQMPQCIDKGEVEAACRSNEECLSDRCRWVWGKFSRRCAEKPQPTPDKQRPNTRVVIPCGGNICNGGEEYCYSGLFTGMFSAHCQPKEKQGTVCRSGHQCSSGSCVFKWRQLSYRCE